LRCPTCDSEYNDGLECCPHCQSPGLSVSQGNKPTIPDLIQVLEEGKRDARKQAAEALSKMGAPTSDELAAALLETGKGARAKVLEPFEDNRLSRIIAPPFEKYPGFRKRLLETLIAIGEPSVGPLSQIVREAHFSVRISAAWALAEIGEPSVDALDLLLKTDDRIVRELASWSLARIKEPAIASLIDELGEDNFRVRDAAKKALVKIGEPAVAPLIAALAGMNEEERAEACGVLVDIGVPAVKQLIAALESESPDVRRLSARTLGDISTTALAFIMRNIKVQLPPGFSKQAIEFTLKQLMPRMEKAVVMATKKVAGAYVPEWILSPILNAAVKGLKPASLFVISRFMPDLYQQLMNFILQVRVPAARPLAELLKDPDESVRLEAATSLGKIASPDTIDALSDCLLADKTPAIRAACAHALGKIGDAKGLEPLEKARQKEKSKKVQERIVESIRSIEKQHKHSR